MIERRRHRLLIVASSLGARPTNAERAPRMRVTRAIMVLIIGVLTGEAASYVAPSFQPDRGLLDFAVVSGFSRTVGCSIFGSVPLQPDCGLLDFR